MTLIRLCLIGMLTIYGLVDNALAQTDFCQAVSSDGSLNIKASSGFTHLIDSTIQANKARNKIKGYRIQIYFGGNRKKARRIKTRFLRNHPQKRAYTVYQQPNFKIRVGNFRNKLEAQKLYHKLNKRFKTVFIVPTRIKYPDLPKPQ